MRPDTSKERRNGWIVLGGAVAACVVALWLYSSDGGLEQRLQTAKASHLQMTGNEPIAVRIDHERRINEILRSSIQDLKQQTGFKLAPFYTITDADVITSKKHPSEIFADSQLSVIHDEIMHRAEDLELSSQPDFGFDSKSMKMTDAETLINSIYLQITDRVAVICFSVPPALGLGHIRDLTISHNKDLTLPAPFAPPGRPPLLREYTVTATVVGPIADIMYILTRFCDPKLTPDPTHPDMVHDPGLYPLVLKKAEFTCDKSVVDEPNQPVPKELDVKAVFTLSALEFIEDSKRPGVPVAPGASPKAATGPAQGGAALSAPAATSSPGSPHQARF